MDYLRSLLSVPGQRQSMIDKAFGLSSDGNLLDLEDAVPADMKDTARRLVAEAVARPRAPGGPARFVRVNGTATGRRDDDIRAVVHANLDAIALPKVERSDEIASVDRLLSALEAERGVPTGQIRLLISIESAVGLVNAYELANASPRNVALFLGGEDLAVDLGLPVTRGGAEPDLIYPRSLVMVAAATARIFSIDRPCMEFKDLEVFRRRTKASRELGFSGGFCIHPSQVAICNEVFSPTPEEVELARKVVAAFDEAKAKGIGAVMMGGQFVEIPIVERAQRTLRLHERISARR